jgi:hypothetical protein
VADPVSEGSTASQQEEAVLVARRRAEEQVPRHRFGLAYLALAAVLGASVGLFVVLVGNGGKDQGPSWSAWKPTEVGVKRLDEIARHIGRQYLLPDGRSLAAVYSTPPVAQSQGQAVPVRAIGVTSGLPGESAADTTFYDAGSTWAYIICGLASTASGPKCSLPGQASVGRFDLLRREALELALYTFKYEKGLDTIVTYMPPVTNTTTGTKGDTAFFFRRSDVEAVLDEPLALTLPPPKGNLRPGQMSQATLSRVRRLTTARLFAYAFGSLQDGSPVLVLQPAA